VTVDLLLLICAAALLSVGALLLSKTLSDYFDDRWWRRHG
jgi:hypothetical protein